MPAEPSLEFRSLFAHVWDFADAGIDPLLGWLAGANLNTICVAGTYHSGWFIHPHHSRHRAFMTEGAVCYFRPDRRLYEGLRLQPTVSKLCDERDWLADAGRRLDAFGVRMVSWTIGVHNSRLGQANPDLTQQNVYGDRLPFALCIAHDDVRAYLNAICRDLAVNHPMWALQLEDFQWMEHRHEHHHERDLVGLTPLELQLMSICFCGECVRRAAASGVDCEAAARVVRGVLDAAFREAPDRPAGHPTSVAELERRSPALRAFNTWRRSFAASVVADIRSNALRGTNCRVLLQTPHQDELRDVVEGFACWAYGERPPRVAEICRAAREPIPAGWAGILQCLVRLGMGVPRSEAELHETIGAVRSNGCNGINFYNRSEAPPKMLQWLARAFNP
jgi:hypothetical protein